MRPARTRRGLCASGNVGGRRSVAVRECSCGGGRGPRVAREPRARRRCRTGHGRRHAVRAAASVSTRGVVLVERPARRLRAPLPSCWSGFRIVMALRGRYRGPEVRRQTFGRRSLPIDRPVAGCRGERGAPGALTGMADANALRTSIRWVRLALRPGCPYPFSPPRSTLPWLRLPAPTSGGAVGPEVQGRVEEGAGRHAGRPHSPPDCRRRLDRRPTRRVVLVERPAPRLRSPRPSCWSGFRIVMALRGRYRGPQVRRQTGRRSLPNRPPVAGCRVEWAPQAPDGDG